MSTVVVTARLDQDTFAGLDRLAAFHDRPRSWLVAKAVANYVKAESDFFAFIQEGEAAIERGDYVTHEQLIAEIDVILEDKKAA